MVFNFFENIWFKLFFAVQNGANHLDDGDSQQQENSAVWVIVAVGIVAIAVFMAACAIFKLKFTGEYSFLGFAFKIKCG